jgi:hypothetical protein
MDLINCAGETRELARPKTIVAFTPIPKCDYQGRYIRIKVSIGLVQQEQQEHGACRHKCSGAREKKRL